MQKLYRIDFIDFFYVKERMGKTTCDSWLNPDLHHIWRKNG